MENNDQKASSFEIKQTPEMLDLFKKISNHNLVRDEHVWLQIYCSVANAWNCTNSETAERWADKGLEMFKKRFRLGC